MAYVKTVSSITLTGAKLLVEAAEAKATEMVRLSVRVWERPLTCELGLPSLPHRECR